MDKKIKIQRFVGIDPGKNGGISSVCTNEKDEVDWGTFRCVSMPVEPNVVMDEMRGCGVYNKTYITIEKLTGFTRASGPDTMFKLGIEFGKAKVVAELLQSQDRGVSLSFVPPQTWQNQITSFKRRDFSSDSHWKNHLKERASLLIGELSGVKPTLKTADSMLILHYLLFSRGLL